MNAKISSVEGKGIVVAGDNIDTDRIIPARFLKEITFSNLGKYPFFDERYDDRRQEREHPFNDPCRQEAKVLFVNKNFGCGSSREHAPQALKRWGIEAVVGESFAEIFASNCMTIGLPAVCISQSDAIELQKRSLEDFSLVWKIDLENLTVSEGGNMTRLTMPDHHRNILLSGSWDSTDLLLENLSEADKLYQSLPYTSGYTSA